MATKRQVSSYPTLRQSRSALAQRLHYSPALTLEVLLASEEINRSTLIERTLRENAEIRARILEMRAKGLIPEPIDLESGALVASCDYPLAASGEYPLALVAEPQPREAPWYSLMGQRKVSSIKLTKELWLATEGMNRQALCERALRSAPQVREEILRLRQANAIPEDLDLDTGRVILQPDAKGVRTA